MALDRTGQRIAAEGAKADPSCLDVFAGTKCHTVVIAHDEGAVALDHRARGGEVKRHDGNVFLGDVVPDVSLGPVR